LRVACVTVSVMPQFDVSRKPTIFSSGGMVRPNTPTFSRFGGMGLPTIACIVKPITEKCVTSCLVTTSQKRVADHFGVSTIVAPTPSALQVAQLCAFTWKKGV
jgi:hypothetical protein